MIHVSYHHDLKEVQGDRILADVIAAHARSPFDRLEWWQGLQAECGLRPLIAVVRDGGDVAILPLQQGDGHLRALANWYNFTIRPVFSQPMAPARANRLMAALARDLRRRAWRVTLAPVPGEDMADAVVARAFAQAGWIVKREQCDVNRYDALSNFKTYADFLAARPGSLRTTLKRKGRKVNCTVYESFSDELWDQYEAIYRASWKPEEGSFAFLRRFARQEAAAGRLRLGIARHDGTPVAAQFWTLDHGTAFIHKLAHVEASKALSAGTILSAALFEHVIDIDHAAEVDFGTGDTPYKRDWMQGMRPRYRIDLFDPRSPRAWPHLVRNRLRGREGVRRRESLVSSATAG